MPSSLAWIDHDASARERSLRILALFQEKESRDELGLGGIRDSFADCLFPGTSTIQTRLRYMLFIPWIYISLEERNVPPERFGSNADKAERDLIDTMRNVDDREAGVFGGRSGRQLKRLPSSVYWSGLEAWGIRKIGMSQDQYHHFIGNIYRRRKEQAEREGGRKRVGDDTEQTPEQGTITWHPKIPAPPKDFPDRADFSLTCEEAEFLLDRIQCTHPKSLMAHLALYCEPVDVSAPWEHPDSAGFSPENIEILDHARRFSMLMRGAALIYNIALAEERSWTEKVDEHRKALADWVEELDISEVRNWFMPRFWEIVIEYGYTITRGTRLFVEEWREIVSQQSGRIGQDSRAGEIVRRRETVLKKSRSRFINRRALDQWGGSSGLQPMTYRWRTASTFLQDLYAGLRRKGDIGC